MKLNSETSNAELVEQMLKNLGEDPTREGLLKTPARVEKSLAFLTGGYQMSIEEVVNDAVFEEAGDEMVVVQDIELYSMCEHHMLPFFGQASVAYIPNGRILGLSKVARIADVFARRLQVQERLTQQIAHAMQEILNPLGVAVVVEAKHFCMMMRGVQKQNSYATTSCMLGVFKDDPKTRSEFLTLVSRHR
jgi:GTP cyclohydrolase IA